MKTNLIKSLAAFLVAACFPILASAQHFEVGGKAYNVLSETDHTVELAMRWSGYVYSGNFVVPSTVTYEGITYDVVALGMQAFYGANLSGLTIPNSVTRIGMQCFLFGNGPAIINIPASVTEIEDMAFAASRTTTFNVSEDNPNFCSIDGFIYSKDSTTLVQCPLGKNGAITLPQSTRHIRRYAMAYCQGLSTVTLNEGLLSIGYGTFLQDSRLDNIVIPSTVTHIGSNLFDACTILNNLSIASGNSHYYMDGMMIYSSGGDTLVSCHKSADSLFLPATLLAVGGFGGNRDIKYVHVPDGVNIINENAFENSTLKSIDMPNSVRFIDEYAFYGCDSLTRVGMPATLDTMGMGCFEYCSSLTSIDIPNGLLTIPGSAFFGCISLSQIAWGDAVEVIDTVAFAVCPFEELYLPATLRSVRLGAFNSYYDGVLRRVVFAAPVDTIEQEVFTGNSLEALRMMNSMPPITFTTADYGMDYGCFFDATIDSIIIPCGSLNAYLSDTYWGQFADKYYEDCNGIDNAPECKISVYPNPATDRLTVINTGRCGYVELVNILGEPIISRKIVDSTVEIDVSDLPRGAYFLRIHTSDDIATRKVVLQ